MAKDKQSNRQTMNDLLAEYKSEEVASPVTKQESLEMEMVKEDTTSKDYLSKLADYNKQYQKVSEKYSKVKPLQNVLVRVMVKEPEISKSGLLTPYKQIVPVPTQNGIAKWAEIESPYPYDTIAVVVAKPDHVTNLNIGDIVILSKNPVEAKVVGGSNDAYVQIPNFFTHPEWKEETPPKDPTNEHYGYLLVPVYEIKAIL